MVTGYPVPRPAPKSGRWLKRSNACVFCEACFAAFTAVNRQLRPVWSKLRLSLNMCMTVCYHLSELPRASALWLGCLQAVKVGMHMSAAFLNNSSSRWEAIWDAWEFRAELVDHVSPIYRSDFLR